MAADGRLAMTVLSFGLDDKLGGEGLAALGIHAPDRLPNAGRRTLDHALDGSTPPVLLLFHGPRTRTDDLLRRHAGLHVLHVRSTRHRYGTLRDREREFAFAVPSLPGEGRWARQAGEVRDRLRRFVESFRRGRPDWALLDAPAVPEHLVACYLAALAGREAPAEWRRGFEREAAAVGSGGASWEERRDVRRMHGLLRRACTGWQAGADRSDAAREEEAGDEVALAGLPCGVAREAGRCRHSLLENVFLGLDDRSLTAWLDDEREVGAFEASARFVCDNAAGFSPVGMLPAIAPLARLPARGLESLRDALEGVFRKTFAPAEVAGRLGARLDALLAEMRRRGQGDATAGRLASIRRAARALHDEMAHLPDGFWLPPPPEGGEPGPRA